MAPRPLAPRPDPRHVRTDLVGEASAGRPPDAAAQRSPPAPRCPFGKAFSASLLFVVSSVGAPPTKWPQHMVFLHVTLGRQSERHRKGLPPAAGPSRDPASRLAARRSGRCGCGVTWLDGRSDPECDHAMAGGCGCGCLRRDICARGVRFDTRHARGFERPGLDTRPNNTNHPAGNDDPLPLLVHAAVRESRPALQRR